MRDHWYKDAVIYCLDVENFKDGNGDGIGDFRGLTSKLDHIAGLGATCLWLLPFYPTPNRDNGYDVMDYYGVDHRLGTLGDFVEFMRRARERGLRVIVDLVVNHTSIQHPWFEAARSDLDSPFHDFYVWSDEKPEDHDDGVIFPGVQESTWTYDRKAKKYYFHRFYKHQPDLNIANPRVREEIKRVMGFWLELGVSGFRIDAAPFLIELKGIDDVAGETDPYEYLRDFRAFLSWRRGDAILLAEANVAPEKVPDYFADGTKLHMLFNFVLNQHLFLALARRRKAPLVKGLMLPPPIPPEGQWAQFLRNHDELALGRLTAGQRDEVAEAFARDDSMWIYDRGVRRRLPPMLLSDIADAADEADPSDAQRARLNQRLRMAYSLLFTLPGTPVLRYGEEIGMGDNLALAERAAVRTPMQWSADPNAGFSPAEADALVRPLVDEGPFRYEVVSVDRQRRSPDSLLAWMERAIRTRKEHDAYGRGTSTIVDTDQPTVFAHACEHEGRVVAAAHHLDDTDVTVHLDLSPFGDRYAVDLLETDHVTYPLDDGILRLDLGPFGFHWFALEPNA